MKTKFIKLFTIALAMSMAFVSCSKDDESPLKAIEQEYKIENVAVKFGDMAVEGATVAVKAIDDKNIVVTLNDVVSGFKTMDIDAVVTTTTKAVEYAFVGEKTVGEMKISINGTINEGKVAINVTNKISSSVVGEWGYNFVKEEDEWGLEDDVNRSVAFIYTNSSNKSIFHEGMGEDAIKEGTNQEFCKMVNNLINGIGLSVALTDVKITFTEDGFISAKGMFEYGATEAEKNLNIEKAARYSYDSEKKMLYITLPAEVKEILGGTDLPLACEVKDGKLCASLKYETLLPLINLLRAIDAKGEITKMLCDMIIASMPEDLVFFAPLVTDAIADIFTALKDVTTTNVQLDVTMAKYVAPAPEV